MAARLVAVVLTLSVAAPAAVLRSAPAAGASCLPRPTSADVQRLEGIRPARPRVVSRRSELRDLAALTKQDPAAAERRTKVRRAANRLIGLTPPGRQIVGGRLQYSEFKSRITTLAVAYGLERDPRYAAQAQEEMLGVSRYRNWNPDHYLDVAELTAAMALGYDWFHDALGVTARSRIGNAIIEKGLRTSLCFYRHGTGPVTRTSNWGIVVNAGLAMGAVAVAESAPRLSAAVLGGALRHIRPALRRFGPDGSYPEGFHYWRYATEHAVKLMATMDAAFGRDFGLSETPGFARTGRFALHSIGPTDLAANFSNATETPGSAPQLLWMAGRFGHPVDAWLAGRLETGNRPMHLLWYRRRVRPPAQADIAPTLTSWPLRSAFFRGRWGSASASYVAVKGGSNAASHAHPELGAFIYDAGGARWARDLGADSYTLPGYFGSGSTSYYRLGTRGQNTLTIDSRNQPVTARAPIVHANTRAWRSEMVLDLSSAYPMTRSTRRGVALVGRRHLLVQDEITSRRRREVRWAMHTTANVRIGATGKYAVLTQGRRTLYARLQRPWIRAAHFNVVSSEQVGPQARNEGVRRLQIVMQTGRKRTRRSLSRLRLIVFLSPDPHARPPPVRRLRNW